MTIEYENKFDYINGSDNYKYRNSKRKKQLVMLSEIELDTIKEMPNKNITISDELIDMAIDYINIHCESNKKKIDFLLWLKDKKNRVIENSLFINNAITLYKTLNIDIYTPVLKNMNINESNMIRFLVYIDKREYEKS
jgi:hypothetical protein